MSKNVCLIKLGGSVITNKEIPMSLRADVLKRLVHEIAAARKQRPQTIFVVGHGQGSFGHVPAEKYKTISGFQNEESRMGMAIVQDTAAQLNRLVVREFLEQDIPAVSLYPSNSLVTKKRVPDTYFTDVFEEYLKQGLFPVTGGDVLIDRGQGCTIWSTEEVLSFFAKKFVEKQWLVEQIVHVVEVDGVYGHNGEVVPEISSKNWQEIRSAITATKGFDVTGGMTLKVEESLALAEFGIKSRIISGLEPGNVERALTDKPCKGTRIL